jgi:uncharacterized SAM-binding protein YcdF (DUF218 family)
MKTNSFTPMGSLHPILFFAVVYIVALFFSIFICSSLFYSCNSSSAKVSQEEVKPANTQPVQQVPAAMATVAMR